MSSPDYFGCTCEHRSIHDLLELYGQYHVFTNYKEDKYMGCLVYKNTVEKNRQCESDIKNGLDLDSIIDNIEQRASNAPLDHLCSKISKLEIGKRKLENDTPEQSFKHMKLD